MTPADRGEAIAGFIAAATGATSVAIEGARPLSGGAIQENWALDAVIEGGRLAGRQALVLRCDSAAGVPESIPRLAEFTILQAAHRAGIAVAEPLLACEDPAVLGRPFFLMRRLAGSADPRRLVRDAALEPQRPALARRLGAELARIHALDAAAALAAPPPAAPVATALAAIERRLTGVPPRPALEWGLRWLVLNAPAECPARLLHGDFRTGNLLVEDGRLVAVLDWEFAGWGDPAADLGWFSARCWRFGADGREAGGLADLETFLGGYVGVAGAAVDRGRVRWWQAFAALRWAVIAREQAGRHLSGRQPSLELALTGRIVPELELDLLMAAPALVREVRP
jgi:aminoglycoside phosphotransferase (APT) family kinase protein